MFDFCSSVNHREKKVNIEDNILECKLCDKSFFDERHLKSHTINEHFLCHTCNRKGFKTKEDLQNHLKIVHNYQNYFQEEPKTIVCELCNKSFVDENYLKIHTIGVHFPCRICNTAFKTKEDLDEHNIENHSEKRYKCNLCSETFIGSGKLIRHKLTVHEKVAVFECSRCEKLFKDEENLKNHMEEHE